MTPGTKVFLDASYAIALASPRDQYHPTALELADRLEDLSIGLVTTVGVILEIGNALSYRRFRREAVALLTALDSDPNVEIVPVSESLYTRALSLFQDRPDKNWGLTDCVSFIVMQDYGLTAALTSDSHFTQAGFQALMLDDGI